MRAFITDVQRHVYDLIMEKETSGIRARGQIDSLMAAATALEVEVIDLRHFEAEAKDVRIEPERMNKMNRERDQVI